jgi:hypothetical protein
MLWYSGNRVALTGCIRVSVDRICFQYPNSGIKSATWFSGPDLECQPLSSFKADIVDSVEGDIFNLSSVLCPLSSVLCPLSSVRIAFVMPKRRYSFDELKSKLSGH